VTIPALLSHFGIDDKRYVTNEGRVIFDGVSASGSGVFSHPSHGAVTEVARHTFHGSTDEPSGASGDAPWWTNGAAVARHADAVKEAFPAFVQTDDDEAAPPAWGGVIDTGRGKFMVGVFTRPDQGLPFVRIMRGARPGLAERGRWQPSPHLYINGNLCIADQADWKPETHTVATAIAWTAHWLAAYTEWRFTRRWPVEGAHPNAA
jgi:hypothetical protein